MSSSVTSLQLSLFLPETEMEFDLNLNGPNPSIDSNHHLITNYSAGILSSTPSLSPRRLHNYLKEDSQSLSPTTKLCLRRLNTPMHPHPKEISSSSGSDDHHPNVNHSSDSLIEIKMNEIIPSIQIDSSDDSSFNIGSLPTLLVKANSSAGDSETDSANSFNSDSSSANTWQNSDHPEILSDYLLRCLLLSETIPLTEQQIENNRIQDFAGMDNLDVNNVSHHQAIEGKCRLLLAVQSDPEAQAQLATYLCHVLVSKKNYEEAEQILMKHMKKTSSIFFQSCMIILFLQSLNGQNKFEEAEYTANKYLELNFDRRSKADFAIELIHSQYKLGHHDELKTTCEIFLEANIPETQCTFAYVLSRYYYSIKNFKKVIALGKSHLSNQACLHDRKCDSRMQTAFSNLYAHALLASLSA